MKRTCVSIFCVLSMLSTLALTGCYQIQPLPPRPEAPVEVAKDYYRELPEGQYALRKITDPDQIPDFAPALYDQTDLRAAVESSLHYLAKPSSEGFFPTSGISHEQVVSSLEQFRDLLDRDLPPTVLADEIRRQFDVYVSVGCDDQGTVLFTGYYTPVFEASLERDAIFDAPLHRLPENHVKDPITGETLGLTRADGSLDADYPSRAELLSSTMLAGTELVYLAEPFEAYVIGVQGSAILRLRDGSQMQVGYAGNNGHDYASLGLALVDAGKLTREELNLANMIAYFRDHPQDFEPMAANNGRYVFFQEGEGGARGCINEPVRAMRSIATDKAIFPRGSLCFIDTTLPGAATSADGSFQGFVLDQDAGGAIRAPGRCDVYMGTGDVAGELAGRTLAEGRMYYLIAKDESEFAAAGW